MAIKTDIKVRGDDEVARSLVRLADETGDLDVAFRRIGDIVLNEARVLAPVQSGALAASITTRPRRGGIAITAGEGLAYAGVIHFGWPAHNIEPQPFLTDAVENQQQAIQRTIDDAIDDAIRHQGLK